MRKLTIRPNRVIKPARVSSHTIWANGVIRPARVRTSYTPSNPRPFQTLRTIPNTDPLEIRVSIPRVLDSGSPQELSIKGRKGVSSLALSPPPPPPPSSPSQPQQSQSILPLMGERTSPSDQPSANDTGNRPDITNSLENLGDQEEALPTLSGNPKHNTQDFPVLPRVRRRFQEFRANPLPHRFRRSPH